MKKKLVVLFMVFALVLSMMSILAVQAAEDGAEVKVVVNKDGTITVTATGTFDENDWVGIYINKGKCMIRIWAEKNRLFGGI